MKRALFAGAAVLAIAVAGGALWLYLSLDHLVRRAVEHYGSAALQVEVTLAEARVAPTDGAGELRGLRVGNPPGFRAPQAASVGAIELAVDPATLAADVVLVRRMVVVAPAITYEPGARGSNFDVLQRNVGRYLGTGGQAAKRPGGRRLIVERLTIKGARVTYAPQVASGTATLSFGLPDIQLTNVGRNRGGVTPGELTQIVVNALVARIADAMGRRALERAAGTLLVR